MDGEPYYLQLVGEDDVLSVGDRLRFLRGRRVALIWPEQGTVFTRKLDLVRIQRIALRNNVRLALVTHDREAALNARDLNISAFETISTSRRQRWKRGRSRLFVNRSQRPINSPLADELAPFASRVRADDAPTAWERWMRRLGRIGLLALIAVMLFAFFAVVVPGATVRIQTVRQAVTTVTQVTGDASITAAQIDVENGLIPAITYRAEIEERGTIATSGIQALGSTPATGTVVLINQTNSRLELPAGSLVSTSSGTPIVFRTLEDAIVPGGVGERVETRIEAVQESSGDVGNVDAGQINALIGELAESVEVINLAPTLGGDSRSARIVTAEDRETLISVLRQQIQDRAFRELTPLAGEGQFLIPETIRIEDERSDWMTFDHEIGAPSDSLTMTMRAVVAVTAIEQQLAEQIAYARLSGQIPRGRTLDPDSLTYLRGEISSIDEAGRVTFDITASGLVDLELDTNQMQERLAGLQVDDAQALLQTNVEQAGGGSVAIELWPSFLDRMPLLGPRITIVESSD
jgi:hypothetical protein